MRFLFVALFVAVVFADSAKEAKAIAEAQKNWAKQDRELRRLSKSANSAAERAKAAKTLKENQLIRKLAGPQGRKAMALSDAWMAADPEDAKKYFDALRKATGKKILFPAGYSGQGYQNPDEAAKFIKSQLGRNGASKYIVSGGVTPDGIGKIGYQVADDIGARTAGVVSEKALAYGTDGLRKPSAYHQNMIIKDSTWGGMGANGKLNPTSDVLVYGTDKYAAAGGGDVMRDEAKVMMKEKGVKSVTVEKMSNNVAKTDAKFEKAMSKWTEGGKVGPKPKHPGYFGGGAADDVLSTQAKLVSKGGSGSKRTAARTNAQMDRLKAKEARLIKLAKKGGLGAAETRQLEKTQKLLARFEAALAACQKSVGSGRALLAVCSAAEKAALRNKIAAQRAAKVSMLEKFMSKTRLAEFGAGYKAERAARGERQARKALDKSLDKVGKASGSRKSVDKVIQQAARNSEKARLASEKAAKAAKAAKKMAAATGSRKAAVGAGRLAGKAMNGAAAAGGAIARVANPLGVALAVGQAGKIISESVADKIEFERKLKQGIYDEKLAKRLKYATVDAILGRGSGEAIHKACSGKGSYVANTKACLSGAWEVTKAIGGMAAKAGKSVARGTKNCALAAFSSKHDCHLAKKETWEKAGSAVKSGLSSVGNWFSEQYKTHKNNAKKGWNNYKWCRANKKACAEKKRKEQLNKRRALWCRDNPKKCAARKEAKKRAALAKKRREEAAERAAAAAIEEEKKEKAPSCNYQGTAGLCKVDTSCETGTVISGLCPGADNVRCCVGAE